MTQVIRRRETRILVALSKLVEILLNPQVQTHSGTVRRTSRNIDVENQEPNGDRYQDDPHPEVGSPVYQCHHSIYSDAEEAPHNHSTRIRYKIKFSGNIQLTACNQQCRTGTMSKNFQF